MLVGASVQRAGLALPTGDELHLWFAPEPGPLADGEVASILELLTPVERERARRFRFDADRDRYLLARAMQRRTLSLYVPERDPAAWRFIAGEHGKPGLGEGPAGLEFNLSHTRGLVAMAVGRHTALGLDVESPTARSAPFEIADRYFTADEVRDLQALPVTAQQARFFALWTLKEAYIKAVGGGLSVPLDEVSFRFVAGSARGSGYEARAARARGFRFWQYDIDGVAVALAARSAQARAPAVRLYEYGRAAAAVDLASTASF